MGGAGDEVGAALLLYSSPVLVQFPDNLESGRADAGTC